jgi:hypothetical protein
MLDGNHGKKIKIGVVFTLGKANNLRLNYPALKPDPQRNNIDAFGSRS